MLPDADDGPCTALVTLTQQQHGWHELDKASIVFPDQVFGATTDIRALIVDEVRTNLRHARSQYAIFKQRVPGEPNLACWKVLKRTGSGMSMRWDVIDEAPEEWLVGDGKYEVPTDILVLKKLELSTAEETPSIGFPVTTPLLWQEAHADLPKPTPRTRKQPHGRTTMS